MNQIVAEALNFRRATVRKWTDKKITTVMCFLPIHDPRLASRLLVAKRIRETRDGPRERVGDGPQ